VAEPERPLLMLEHPLPSRVRARARGEFPATPRRPSLPGHKRRSGATRSPLHRPRSKSPIPAPPRYGEALRQSAASGTRTPGNLGTRVMQSSGTRFRFFEIYVCLLIVASRAYMGASHPPRARIDQKTVQKITANPSRLGARIEIYQPEWYCTQNPNDTQNPHSRPRD
jgi:hypothetical protein